MTDCEEPPALLHKPAQDQTTGETVVRVLLDGGLQQVRFRSALPIAVADEEGHIHATHPADQWLDLTVTSAGRIGINGVESPMTGLTLTTELGQSILMSVSADGAPEGLAGREYDGAMRVTMDEDRRIKVVNLVPLERYVACVVADEVWPTFEKEALRAQAIAARSYVLYQMQRRSGASYDVAASQGAQVYRGIRRDATARRAADAAHQTRGLVCTWRKDGVYQLFSTYYSSACGGMSQSAAIFGEADDIRPLQGGITCHFCRIAPGDSYRWGPAELPAEDVFSRLVSRFPELASLEGLREVTAGQVTASGRLVRLELVGASGERTEMLAERFRLAVGGDLMRSTDCEIRLEEGVVRFSRGRGYGHGLGLCQWGMQGQALAGKNAEEILRFYYPGSKLLPLEKVHGRL